MEFRSVTTAGILDTATWQEQRLQDTATTSRFPERNEMSRVPNVRIIWNILTLPLVVGHFSCHDADTLPPRLDLGVVPRTLAGSFFLESFSKFYLLNVVDVSGGARCHAQRSTPHSHPPSQPLEKIFVTKTHLEGDKDSRATVVAQAAVIVSATSARRNYPSIIHWILLRKIRT
jgi:hypothetical protein